MSKRTLEIIFAFILLALFIGAAYIFYKKSGGVVNDVSHSITNPGAISSACQIKTSSTLTIYSRPSKESDVFGTISTIDGLVTVTAKSDNGWFAFDPGTAQAANVGPFRYRYFIPDVNTSMSGDCNHLSVIPALPPQTCFLMSQDDAQLYANPSTSSGSVTSIKYGDYAPVIAKNVDNGQYWLELDTTHDSTIKNVGQVWIEGSHANFSGDCSAFVKE